MNEEISPARLAAGRREASKIRLQWIAARSDAT
jgi:hypothetical protein